MAESLEEQVNAAYARLAYARKRKREINEYDTGRLESVQLSALHQEFKKHEAEEAGAELEIERLKLCIQARLADG